MNNKCNGTRTPRTPFSYPIKLTLYGLIPLARKAYLQMMAELKPEGQYVSSRFNSDDSIYETIESGYSEEELLKDMGGALFDGLRNCAERDYYYTFEKNYE